MRIQACALRVQPRAVGATSRAIATLAIWLVVISSMVLSGCAMHMAHHTRPHAVSPPPGSSGWYATARILSARIPTRALTRESPFRSAPPSDSVAGVPLRGWLALDALAVPLFDSDDSSEVLHALVPGETVTSETLEAAGGPVRIAGGGYHTLAITADGSVATWGHNLYGQLGLGDTWSPQVVVWVP